MRSVPESFYHSEAWKICRQTYLDKHPLCENCLAQGIYTPAYHVHHIVWLNESNYTNPKVSLNHDNLKALCIQCHNQEHKKEHKRRYKVSEDGQIAPLSQENI